MTCSSCSRSCCCCCCCSFLSSPDCCSFIMVFPRWEGFWNREEVLVDVDWSSWCSSSSTTFVIISLTTRDLNIYNEWLLSEGLSGFAWECFYMSSKSNQPNPINSTSIQHQFNIIVNLQPLSRSYYFHRPGIHSLYKHSHFHTRKAILHGYIYMLTVYKNILLNPGTNRYR